MARILGVLSSGSFCLGCRIKIGMFVGKHVRTKEKLLYLRMRSWSTWMRSSKFYVQAAIKK